MSGMTKITDAYIKRLIRDLNKYCFYAGTEKYMSAKGLGEVTPKLMEPILGDANGYVEFASFVNWSYKKAQRIIIRERLKVERGIKAGSIEFERPYNESYLLSVLTDYANCIAWTMLKHDISAVRNVFFDTAKKSSPLDEQNWASIQKTLDHYNKDPNQFALATDLTSFFHVGDVYCLNTEKRHSYKVEVKSGKVNEQIIELLQSEGPEDFKEKTFRILGGSENPIKTSKQIARVLRQQQRALTTQKYEGWGSTSRIDLITNRPVRIHEEKRNEENWSAAVRDVTRDMESHDTRYATGWVDRCLFFAYGRKRLTNIDVAFFRFRINEHFGLGLTREQAELLPIFRHNAVLGEPTISPRSLLYWMHLGLVRQPNLMAGEEFLLVYLHIPALEELLNRHGYNLRLRNAQEVDRPYMDGLLKMLFGENKLPTISKTVDGHDHEWTILSGTWQKIIFEFMAPIELINYSNSSIEDAIKLKNTKTREPTD